MSAFESLLDEFFAFWWETHPEAATIAGIHAHDGRLASQTREARERRTRACRDYVEAFEASSPRDTAARLDRDLIVGQLRWEIYDEEVVGTRARNPLVYLEQPLTALYLMATRTYAPPAVRARAGAELLGRMPTMLDEAMANLMVRVPTFAASASRMARSGCSLLSDVLASRLGAALEDPGERRRWDETLRAAESALDGFADRLDTDAGATRGGYALGRDAFQAKLELCHGLRDTPAGLAAFGHELKRQVTRELEATAVEIDARRDWRTLTEELKDDHPAATELIPAYSDEVARARRFIEERGLVGIPADEELEVCATPDYLRGIVPYAAYQPAAPFEAEQKGVFYVTPPPPDAERTLRDHPRHGIVVTALHETYPGHHLQISWANRADSVPRRVFWTSLFAEGWALYCEELMWEHRFYTDPRQRLLQLRDLLWRACRVIVDVGLHVDGWDVARAVDYMVDEAGLERPAAEIEVHRYCAEPTQPLSYAVGKREILALRDRYRAAHPDAGIRAFHDELLRWGTIPTSLIARAMGLD